VKQKEEMKNEMGRKSEEKTVSTVYRRVGGEVVRWNCGNVEVA